MTENQTLILTMVIVFMVLLIGDIRNKRKNEQPVQRKNILVEIFDEMTKEKVRNLYEEQEIYNAQIAHLMSENEKLSNQILKIDDTLNENLKEVQIAVDIQPDCNMDILEANYEVSNESLNNRKMKLQGHILNNQERIVKYKYKSNEVSMKLDKIGRDI